MYITESNLSHRKSAVLVEVVHDLRQERWYLSAYCILGMIIWTPILISIQRRHLEADAIFR